MGEDRLAPASPTTFNQGLFLVTGGSSGIGRAVCRCLAAQGARVLVQGRDPGRLQETLATMSGSGHAAVERTLSDLDQASAWVVELAKEHGPLSGLVHSAGLNSGHPLRTLRQAQLAELMSINVDVAFGLMKGLRQKSVHAPGAAVVLVASVMGLVGAPSKMAYSASKGALIALARSAALELARDDVRVNCLAPGYVATDMLEALRGQLTEAQFEEIRARHPLGFGTPEDVAKAAAFLLSDAARWITGTTLVVDGGYSAQ